MKFLCFRCCYSFDRAKLFDGRYFSWNSNREVGRLINADYLNVSHALLEHYLMLRYVPQEQSEDNARPLQEPCMLSSQIVTMQCQFYLFLGFWTVLIDFFGKFDLSLDQIFTQSVRVHVYKQTIHKMQNVRMHNDGLRTCLFTDTENTRRSGISTCVSQGKYIIRLHRDFLSCLRGIAK